MPGGSVPAPDLDYIASLLDQHDPGPAGGSGSDENRTPANLLLTPSSWKHDHWLSSPPDLPSHIRLDPPPPLSNLSNPSTATPLSTEQQKGAAQLLDHHDDRPWRSSHQLTRAPDLTPPPPPPPPTPPSAVVHGRTDPPDHVLLHRHIQDLQLQLQATVTAKADLEHALETARSREHRAQDDLNKCNETVQELRRINQKLVEEHALYEAKINAQLRKDERIRGRLETELNRQKDLVRDITDEAARLRAALQEAANETELCIQREKENWARAESLRNEQLIQRLKQEAAQAAVLRPAEGAIRERDLHLAQLQIQLAEQQRLLEQQQKDNERLVDQVTKLQGLLDEQRIETTRRSPETSLLLELKEIQAKTRSDVSQSTQAVIDERNLLCSEFNELKQQLRQITEHFASVESRLERQTDTQTNIQKQIADLEARFRSVETDVSMKSSTAEPVHTGPASLLSNDMATREQLARHLQRAAELGVDLPPHMPRLHHHQTATKPNSKSGGEPGRPSISSTASSRTKQSARRAPAVSTAKKSAKRTTQTRSSPVRSHLYPPTTSWR